MEYVERVKGEWKGRGGATKHRQKRRGVESQRVGGVCYLKKVTSCCSHGIVCPHLEVGEAGRGRCSHPCSTSCSSRIPLFKILEPPMLTIPTEATPGAPEIWPIGWIQPVKPLHLAPSDGLVQSQSETSPCWILCMQHLLWPVQDCALCNTFSGQSRMPATCSIYSSWSRRPPHAACALQS